MTRTISKNLKERLIAQVEEANFQGLDKVASSLTTQVQETPVREDLEDYLYSSADLQKDVENLLWKAAIRAQDYYGKTADAKEIGGLIESCAEELISGVRNTIGGDVIGPHEPLVPGEERLTVEIDEDGR
jgi:hypothetical protein